MYIPTPRRTKPQCWSILWNMLYTRNYSQFMVIVEFPNNRREDIRSLLQLSCTIASSMTNFQNPRLRSSKLRSVGFKIAWKPMCITNSIRTKPQWRSILWNVWLTFEIAVSSWKSLKFTHKRFPMPCAISNFRRRQKWRIQTLIWGAWNVITVGLKNGRNGSTVGLKNAWNSGSTCWRSCSAALRREESHPAMVIWSEIDRCSYCVTLRRSLCFYLRGVAASLCRDDKPRREQYLLTKRFSSIRLPHSASTSTIFRHIWMSSHLTLKCPGICHTDVFLFV